jgi:TRAP-type C4-dicarboxylate transport system permease small subunit
MFFLGALSLLVFAGVVARVTENSIAWTEGLIIYFFSWLTYIAAAVVLRDKGHIGVTFVIDKIKSQTAKKVLTLVRQLVILVMAIAVVVISSQMIQTFFLNDLRDHNIVWLKMAYVFLQVPISNGLFALFILEQMLEVLFVTPKAEAAGGEYDVGDVTAKG